MLYALMVLCAVGMVYANVQYKKKGAVWARPLAGACGLLAVFFALLKITWDLSGCEQSKVQSTIRRRENHYLNAQMQTLGEHLAKKYGGARILLIHSPISQHNKDRFDVTVEALENGLKKGVGTSITAKISPPPPEGANSEDEMMMYYEEMGMEATVFDKMLAEHSECDLVVSLIGLPWNYQDMEFWKTPPEEEKPQKLVLVNASLYDLKPAFKAGYIVAAVVTNPDFRYKMDEEPPRDLEEAFEKRYLLLHAENVDEIHSKYPKFFKAEEKKAADNE